jgi:hypothetical protein
MMGETINNIIGYTFNPKNQNLASGGSSGGEGALIGLKGSQLTSERILVAVLEYQLDLMAYMELDHHMGGCLTKEWLIVW